MSLLLFKGKGMHKQKGSLLVELAVVVAIITLIAAGTVVWMTQQAEKTKTESLAVFMLSIQQGLQSLLDTYAFDLLKNSSFSLPGVSSLHQPTLQELKQLGFLAPSFPVNNAVKLVLYKEGSCPGAQCHIHGLVYSTQPLLNKKQQVNMHAVAQWQSEAKGAGLVVLQNKPMTFTGVQLVVEQQKLPVGLHFPVGTVALLASTDASIIARGGLNANENPNFQTDVDIQGSLNTANDLHVGRYLVLPRTETLGATCSITGAVARGRDGKGLMSCESRKWTRPISTPPTPPVPPPTSLKAYKEMVREIWKINIPDNTPGGFYATSTSYFSKLCWVPNPLRRHTDGRGQCFCPPNYRDRQVENLGWAIKDLYFENGIARPELRVYVCV